MQDRLVDIGINLTDKQFNHDREEVLERAVEAGVDTLILTGTSLAESLAALELANRYPEHCFSTAGIHPHDAKSATEQCFSELKALYAEEKVVAVGETGLDFNRDFSPRPVQEEVFERQLEMAAEAGLPVFCHERDASERLAGIIRQHRDRLTGAGGSLFYRRQRGVIPLPRP